jgi:hypothetical protein
MTLISSTKSSAISTALGAIDFSKRTVSIVRVDKHLAETWLLLNRKNRKINVKTINKLTTDLLGGSFMFTGEAIKFSWDGFLLDGQHRLTAICRTGVAVELVVITGVQTEAQSVMDSGGIRTLTHALEMKDIPNPTSVASALIAIQSWERGLRSHDGSAASSTNSTGLRFLDENPEIVALAYEAQLMAAKLPGLTCKQVALFFWVFDRLEDGHEDRVAFFESLRTGASLSEDHPILTLRNFLSNDAMSAARVSSVYRMAVTVKAWNAYRDAVTIKKLSFKPGGSNPEAFPEPR